jgi:MoxR-like ATPase
LAIVRNPIFPKNRISLMFNIILPTLEKYSEPRRSVVLIDEIDKAPRDFPNDILDEVENWCFRIPELGHVEIQAADHKQPILILTSNSDM